MDNIREEFFNLDLDLQREILFEILGDYVNDNIIWVSIKRKLDGVDYPNPFPDILEVDL